MLRRALRLSSFARLGGLAIASLVGVGAIGCNASSAPRTPEETCVAACRDRVRACDGDGCERGCNYALDRLIEHQGEPVLACMAKGSSCDDRTWSACSVRVGPHADGGPPAPPRAPEDD